MFSVAGLDTAHADRRRRGVRGFGSGAFVCGSLQLELKSLLGEERVRIIFQLFCLPNMENVWENNIN